MLRLGNFEVHCIVENRFHLDGGSVYGIVPKAIWSKIQPADENNLLPFDTNVFVVRTGERNIIFDVGLGNFLEEKQRKLYGCYQPSRLMSGLTEIGLSPDQIDIVILSHLHWDHVGGAIFNDNGKPAVVFHNAHHYVHRDEWEDANNPDERTAGVYFPDRLRALEESGRLRLVESDEELLPGVFVRRIGGHTRGQLGVEITSQGEKLVYYADNLLSCHHLKVPYVPATDLFPLETQRCKRELLPRAYEGGWLIAMDHDIEHKVVRLDYDGLKYRCIKVNI